MAKMITVKPKKALVLMKGTNNRFPRFLKLKSNENIYMEIPEETFTKKDFNPDLDIRLIQVNNVDAINNYMLYVAELKAVAVNSGDVNEELIDILTDLFFKLKDKRDKLIEE